MSNLTVLNKHLFDQLDRLSNTSLKGDALKDEIDRSKAMSSVAKDIVGSAKLTLEAQQYIGGHGGMRPKTLPAVLAIGPGVPK